MKSSEAHGVIRKFCMVCYRWYVIGKKWYSCGVADRGGDSLAAIAGAAQGERAPTFEIHFP